MGTDSIKKETLCIQNSTMHGWRKTKHRLATDVFTIQATNIYKRIVLFIFAFLFYFLSNTIYKNYTSLFGFTSILENMLYPYALITSLGIIHMQIILKDFSNYSFSPIGNFSCNLLSFIKEKACSQQA